MLESGCVIGKGMYAYLEVCVLLIPTSFLQGLIRHFRPELEERMRQYSESKVQQASG